MALEYTFNGQRPDETVEAVVKNHPFVLFWPGLKAIILLAIPAAILIFFGASTLFSVAAFICVIIAFAIFANAYYLFSASMFLITSERVIYLDQRSFFRRVIIESPFDKIQDISSDTKGMTKTTLDMGNVIIRTAGAGAGSEIVVKNIAHPYEVQQEITKRTRALS